MNNTNNKNINALASIKEDDKYFMGALLRTRLATEVSALRTAKDITQQQLAKKIETTQKIVSEVENGNVNIGVELLGRFSKSLDFNTDNFVKIFDCPRVASSVVYVSGLEGLRSHYQNTTVEPSDANLKVSLATYLSPLSVNV